MTVAKRHADCHAANVSRWPIGAKVWYRWGSFGWRPAVIVGHTRCRVVLAYRDKTTHNLKRRSHASPNNITARRDGVSPPRRGYVLPTCLTMTRGAA